MTRIVITSTADADVADILTYLANEAGYRTAAKYLELFDALYGRLSRYPKSGARRAELGEAARIGIVSPFVVIYDYIASNDTVTILRIVHGRRKISAQLLSE